MLFGASNIGRDLAPRCAARLHTGLCADCTHLDVDLDGYVEFLRNGSSLDVDSMNFSSRLFDVNSNLKMTRPAFGGNIMATILTPRHRPQMATVRHKVFKEAKPQSGRKGEIIVNKVDASKIINRTKFLQFFKDDSAHVNLHDADIIVSGGRGLGKPEGFKLVEELADLLGGAVGSSRAAVDSEWIPYSHQVGQTGTTVSPKVYIACGISGQIQHMIGMGSAETIIAINK
jgi:electron transfer flavoprotein alpha subunit